MVIGEKGAGIGSHFSEQITLSFRKLGHDVDFVACNSIEQLPKTVVKTEDVGLYLRYKIPFVIDQKDYDLIFIDQCDMNFKVQTNVPIFYNHKYIHRKFGVFYPTVAFFLTSFLRDYCVRISAPFECYMSKQLDIMSSAINPETFKPKEKTINQLVGIGDRSTLVKDVSTNELMSIASIELIHRDNETFKKLGFVYFEEPILDLQYRELLPKCESIWFSFPRGQYFSRRMLEAMACKTLFVFQLQGSDHEQVLKENGFENMKHYVGFERFSDLKYIYNSLSDSQKKNIIENAYKVVMERHTYDAKAKFILQIFKDKRWEGKI